VKPASFELVADSGPGGDCLISLRGEFDRSTSPQITELAAWFLRSCSSEQLTFDMSAVDFIDASTVKALLDADRSLQSAGRVLVLDSVPPVIERILRFTHADPLLGD